MYSFQIWPSEALKIGLNVGEYLAQPKAEPESKERFLGFLQRRIGPYVPEVTREQRVEIGEEEIPEDVEWHANGYQRRGLSPSHPNTLFLRDDPDDLRALDEALDEALGLVAPEQPSRENAVTKVTWDRSRKWLQDLLNAALGDAVGRSVADKIRLKPHETPGAFDVVQAAVEYEDAADNLDYDKVAEYENRPDRDDSAGDIRDRLRAIAIAEENGCGEYYELGLVFGTALGLCDVCEDEVGRLDDPQTGDGFMDDLYEDLCEESWEPYQLLRKTIAELLKERLVVDGCHGRYALKSVPEIDPMKMDDIVQPINNMVKDARGAIWLALGEILGTLHQADEEARSKDYSLPVSRTWVDLFDATGDKIRAFVQDAERDLNEQTGKAFSADRIVAYIGNVLEALVRMTFDLSTLPRATGTIWEFLRNKSRYGSPIEQRFSAIALTLHSTYRNPESHEFLQITCTLEEARFVVVGIRALLRLSEEIRNDNRPKSG